MMRFFASNLPFHYSIPVVERQELMARTSPINKVLDNKKKQYKINSYCNSHSDSNCLENDKPELVSPIEAKQIVEQLDPRVYRNDQFLPFYCKAVRTIGRDKMFAAQSMALDQSVRSPEKLFAWLLRKEMSSAR